MGSDRQIIHLQPEKETFFVYYTIEGVDHIKGSLKLTQPSDTLHVTVEYFDGQTEGDDGHPYYVASCSEINIVTSGSTLDELFKNLREVIAFALEGEDTIETYNVVPNPHVSIAMELPDYAQIA